MARRRNRLRSVGKMYPSGVLEVRAGGYGFVRTAEGEYFIPSSKLGVAFNGDLVEVSPLSSGQKGEDRPTARVVRVITRSFDTVIGRYEVADPFGVVVPCDQRLKHDIFTLRADNPDIADGSLVRVRLVTYPERGSAATGVIEEVLGLEDDSSMDVEIIIARNKLPLAFPPQAEAEAGSLTLDVSKALHTGYVDLRERLVLTIDPQDARDFDDAVSFQKIQDEPGVVSRVGVHIADVTAYVPWNSSLDLEARKRGTSVYLCDRVIPMLPECLSNDLCSLRPQEDRLTMTVDLFLDKNGMVVRSAYYPAVIRSKARLTYQQVQAVLDGDHSEGIDVSAHGELPGEVDPAIFKCICELSAMAQLRRQMRRLHGSIDFDIPEVKVDLDEKGSPVGYHVRQQSAATQLIEECMLMANEAVARYLVRRKHPGMFRIHELPDSDNLEALVPVFREFEWFADVDEHLFAAGDSSTLAKVLDLAAVGAESVMVSSLLLRSMKRASYSHECLGHYGLGAEHYSHFTSPIRRYPDLVLHRMLKHSLGICPADEKRQFSSQIQELPWIAEHCSERERVAEHASRQSQECKLLQLMEPQVGHVFQGVISGVMSYGFYVRLDNSLEGLVSVHRLEGEYYSFDPLRHALVGQDSGKTFALGKPVSVVLKQVDTRNGMMDFRLRA